ncbi:hypothetical protein CENSYa_2055 [Cenarchaeum symbiosum A]|uniref:Uncharacterized protein n=1 Tax=Cenarchaeum symbiosum (strain A) TaxID=414004 RepID=A0RZ91_CENSY|nr:hypothetical protein CENSYa_2055 [Cenarchaeum symbiosum A]
MYTEERAELERLRAKNKRLKAGLKRQKAEIRRLEARKKMQDAQIRQHDDLVARMRTMLGIGAEVLEMIEKPDLKNLMFPNPARKESRARIHDVIVRGLDGMLADGEDLHEITGYTAGELRHMLDGFTKAVMADESRPLFNGGPGERGINRCKMKMEHLLIMVLFHARIGPEQACLAAAFNTDHETAARNLAYAMSAYLHVVESPEGIVARLMDALDRGAYGEVERELPGLALFITSARIPCELPDDDDDQLGNLIEQARKGCYDELVVSGGRHIIGAVEAPPAGTGIEALEQYMSDKGGYLERLTRPLPDGRRWTIVAGAGFQRLERLLPWADVITPHKKLRRRAVSLQQREHNRMLADGRKSAEQMTREIKKFKLACGPAYENFGTGEMLQLTAGMVNSHMDWNAGTDSGR